MAGQKDGRVGHPDRWTGIQLLRGFLEQALLIKMFFFPTLQIGKHPDVGGRSTDPQKPFDSPSDGAITSDTARLGKSGVRTS